MRVDLIFPPYFSFQSPYLALPSLVGHLRARGVDARALDLNIELVHRLLSADFMDECVGRIKRRLAVDRAATDVTGNPMGHYLAVAELIRPRLEACKDVERSQWDPKRVAPARSVINHAMEVVSAAFSPSRVDYVCCDYRGQAVVDMGLASMLARDGATNIFGALIEPRDIERVLSEGPDLVGLSLTSIHQLVPTLTLVDRLKAAAPDVPIVIGGAMTLFLSDILQRQPDLLSGVDFVVVGEGETALMHLLAAMSGARPMESVENLYFRKGARFHAGQVGHVEDVQELGPPDFEGTPWEKYLAPTRVVPYMSSRGCYWDKCSFCSLCATVMNTYRERHIDKVIADLQHLATTDHFSPSVLLTDECFSPRRLRLLSRALIEADLNLEWNILARFEKAFTAEDFTLAASAGLNWITWGLESASPHVLEQMGKGIRPEAASRLLRAAHDAGIWNNVFVLFGFPGETDEDYGETRAFVRENQEFIDSLPYSTFRLEKGADIFRHWRERGIELVDTPDTFIGPVYPFEYAPPMDHAQVMARMDDFEAFILRETRLSSLVAEGFTPANLMGALHHLAGKAQLRELIEARTDYYRAIFNQEGWHREQRFRPGPTSTLPQTAAAGLEAGDTAVFAEATGRVIALNASGSTLLDHLHRGLSLVEVLEALQNGRGPTEDALASALPFLRHLLWRGVLEPSGGGVLPPIPWASRTTSERR